MLFNSYEFLLLFLPFAVTGYYGIAASRGRAAAHWFLVVASLLFYAYWKPPYVGLILGSIGANFALARALAQNKSYRRALLAGGVAANLAVLAWYKYAGFIASLLNRLGADLAVFAHFLPLAISFFTFTQVAYLVDVYRGDCRAYSFREYCFFVLFFPHLIAGPIVRHDEILPQCRTARLHLSSMTAAVGLSVLAMGLAKKVLLADRVAPIATAMFQGAAHTPPDLLSAWCGALAYSVQLYLDFSGYSDMAIGLAYLFGYRLPLNFDSPYRAASIIDFWRRWHISLSRFLRDYVYIPLGGGRCGKARRYGNLFTTMLIGGLWHGAGLAFIAWGALHGLYLVINHGWRELVPETSRWRSSKLDGLYRAFTFLCVLVGWVIFRAGSLSAAKQVLASMSGLNAIVLPSALAKALPLPAGYFAPSPVSAADALWIVTLLLLAIAFPNTQELMARIKPALSTADSAVPGPHWSCDWRWGLAMGALFALVLASLGQVSEFLYFQF